MRGLAITFIALHNFCHSIGASIQENESSFAKENVNDFFNQLGNFSNEWIYNLFSFLGWYGVPVFVFLTAFGLTKKYECNSSAHLKKGAFLYNNWLKLFTLFLPAAIFLILHLCVTSAVEKSAFPTEGILRVVFMMTFLNDPVFPLLPPYPVIYWYLGLTLEFYFLYAFIVYKKPLKNLLILTAAAILLQYAFLPGEWNGFKIGYLRWLRMNIIGWMVPFSFGIIFARKREINTIAGIAAIIMSLVLFFPTMWNPVSWQISLICAVIITILLSIISNKIPYWRNMWVLIGKLSPFIFVAHPLVRLFILYYLPPIDYPKASYIILYLFAVIVCAILYKQIWKLFTPRIERMLKKDINYAADTK